jgi:hypothetical protein
MRAWVLMLALVGCGRQGAEFRFPAELPGGWRLAGKPVESLELALPDARSHGLEGLTVADYSGNGGVKVLVHRMISQANAFDTLQRFRPESGTGAFQYGIFLVVVRSPALGQSGLNRFADELKRSISQ